MITPEQWLEFFRAKCDLYRMKIDVYACIERANLAQFLEQRRSILASGNDMLEQGKRIMDSAPKHPFDGNPHNANLEKFPAKLENFPVLYVGMENGTTTTNESEQTMPKHSIYLPETIHKMLDLGSEDTKGVGARLSTLAQIALECMRDNVPTLTLAEWQCLCDVTNGHYRSHNDTLAAQLESWVFSIADSGPGCDEKWHVNCRVLARKINALPLIQKCAAYEVCRRFWIRSDINALHEDYAAMLSAHGARITD